MLRTINMLATADPDGMMEFLKIAAGGLTGGAVLMGFVVLFLRRTVITRGEKDEAVAMLKAELAAANARADKWEGMTMRLLDSSEQVLNTVASKRANGGGRKE